MSSMDQGQPIVVSDMRPRPGLVIEYETEVTGDDSPEARGFHSVTRITYDEPPRDLAEKVIERALAYIFTDLD